MYDKYSKKVKYICTYIHIYESYDMTQVFHRLILQFNNSDITFEREMIFFIVEGEKS